MSEDGTAPVPAVVKEQGTGPFVLKFTPGEDRQFWEWTYSVRDGQEPTPAQISLANRCSRLRDRILRFQRSRPLLRALQFWKPRENYLRYHRGIRDTFSVGLVHVASPDILEALETQLKDIETDFVLEHAVHRYRWRVAFTLIIGVLIVPLIAAAVWFSPLSDFLSDSSSEMQFRPLSEVLATPLPEILSSPIAWLIADPPKINHFSAYVFVIFGVIAGRIISLFVDFGKQIETFDAYDDGQRIISSPVLDALIDVLIGFVACLTFVTGAVVISIGQTDQSAQAGLTTLNVADSWEIALVFGVLIGLVRAQFIGRLTGVAKTGVG